MEISALSVPCRGYSKKKLSENMECEIMHVIVEEARESYRWAACCMTPSRLVVGLHVVASELLKPVNSGNPALLPWIGCCLPCQPCFPVFMQMMLISSSCTSNALRLCSLHSKQQQQQLCKHMLPLNMSCGPCLQRRGCSNTAEQQCRTDGRQC